jgi:hypothetical protein
MDKIEKIVILLSFISLMWFIIDQSTESLQFVAVMSWLLIMTSSDQIKRG